MNFELVFTILDDHLFCVWILLTRFELSVHNVGFRSGLGAVLRLSRVHVESVLGQLCNCVSPLACVCMALF